MRRMDTTHRPMRVQVREAKRGERLSASWHLPVEGDSSAPWRRLIISIEKLSRAGSERGGGR